MADGSIDIGGAVLRQPGLADASVVTAGIQYRYSTLVSSVTVNGIAARTPDDRYTGQGVISGSLYGQPGRWRWELSGTGSGFGVSDAGPAFGVQALAREHLVLPLGSVFAGAGGGIVYQAVTGTSRLSTAHIGGLIRPDALDREELSGALAYTSIAGEGRERGYVDGIGYWTHRAGRLELVAGGDVRKTRGSRIATGGSASATLWLTDRTALVLAGGRALEDVARGIPSVRYVAASIRLGRRAGSSPLAGVVRRERSAAEDIGHVMVRATDDTLREVSVRLPSASTVELMADFTDWQPVAMTCAPNGTWTLERAIAAGTHRIAIRVDGTAWRVPPNLPSVEDDFGGIVGLIIVP